MRICVGYVGLKNIGDPYNQYKKKGIPAQNWELTPAIQY
jgi:hypothetical protein